MSHPPATIAGMNYFSPHLSAPRPCWHCRSFAGMVFGGAHSACALTGARRIRASPVTGCSAWVREPGADDEPGPPGGVASTPALVGVQDAVPPVLWAP